MLIRKNAVQFINNFFMFFIPKAHIVTTNAVVSFNNKLSQNPIGGINIANEDSEQTNEASIMRIALALFRKRLSHAFISKRLIIKLTNISTSTYIFVILTSPLLQICLVIKLYCLSPFKYVTVRIYFYMIIWILVDIAFQIQKERVAMQNGIATLLF